MVSPRAENCDHGGHKDHPGPSSLRTVGIADLFYMTRNDIGEWVLLGT
jgi:hypothetical protein